MILCSQLSNTASDPADEFGFPLTTITLFDDMFKKHIKTCYFLFSSSLRCSKTLCCVLGLGFCLFPLGRYLLRSRSLQEGRDKRPSEKSEKELPLGFVFF